MLTGIFEPSNGRISIYGKDLKTHSETIRKRMGYCPQHDILFEQ